MDENNNLLASATIHRGQVWLHLLLAMAGLWIYLILARPSMQDDGFVYQSFTETLVQEGRFDFKNHYGFMGLSLLNIPTYLLTGSHQSLIITSLLLMALLMPLALWTARGMGLTWHECRVALCLLLLYPEPQVVLFRGFQEPALLFFAILTLGLLARANTLSPLIFGFTCIIKPFVVAYAPMVALRHFNRKHAWLLAVGSLFVLAHLGLTWMQTGHLINSGVNNIYKAGQIPNLTSNFSIFSAGPWISLFHALFISNQMQLSPVILMAGVYGILGHRFSLPKSTLLLALLINGLMVGSMVGMFSKYLLPAMVVLLFCSAPVLARRPAWMVLVFITTLPMIWQLHYRYIGIFSSSQPILLIPYSTAILLWCWLEWPWICRHGVKLMEKSPI